MGFDEFNNGFLFFLLSSAETTSLIYVRGCLGSAVTKADLVLGLSIDSPVSPAE